MTEQHHALNRVLAHLISGKELSVPEAVELVDRVRDEVRAQAWDSPEARAVAEDAQSWHLLRAAVLPTVDDPHVWDDGATEAEVLAAWVKRLAGRSGVPVFFAPVVRMEDTETTQPIAALGAPRRKCPSGAYHKPHVYSASGVEHFCPGRSGQSIPSQPGPDGSEQDAAS